jgi:hypothetical protein
MHFQRNLNRANENVERERAAKRANEEECVSLRQQLADVTLAHRQHLEESTVSKLLSDNLYNVTLSCDIDHDFEMVSILSTEIIVTRLNFSKDTVHRRINSLSVDSTQGDGVQSKTTKR